MYNRPKATSTSSSTSNGLRHMGSAVALVLLFAIIVGCANTRGPELMINSHIAYNKAVSQVLKEELLLNIVRRRYMEAPQFLNVSSISSNISTSRTIGADGKIADINGADIVDAGVDGSISFSDSPTITITPRQGEDIASQLHEPLSVSTIADLVTAGYSLPGVLNMLVEGINNLRGSDLRYDGFRPATPEWRETIALLEKFSNDGSLIVDRFRWNDPYNDYAYPAESITPEMWITTLTTGARRWKSYDGGKTFLFTSHEMAPAIWLDPDIRQSSDGQRLMKLLNVQPDVKKKIWILEPARVAAGADLTDRDDKPRSTLKLRMRSLYNVLNLYSYGVHVPPKDEQEKRATDLSSFREAVTRGEIDDISELLAIRYSESVPETAYQAVRYRGLWFYIDDRDLKSKAGFNALYDLWQLSVKAPGTERQPVTTIQVN
jgi:hypothetical protein